MSAEVSRPSSGLLDSNMLYFFLSAAVFLVVYHYGRKYARMIQLSAKIPGPDIVTMLKMSLGTFYAEPHGKNPLNHIIKTMKINFFLDI